MSAPARYAAGFTDAERRTLLQQAAALLELQQHTSRATHCYIELSPGRNALALWRWPGFVTVTCQRSGALIARSLPALPRELEALPIAEASA